MRTRRRRNLDSLISAAFVGLPMLALCACDRHEPDAGPPATRSAEQPSLWRTQNQATIIAVRDEASDPELAAAVAQARKSADKARQKWTDASPEDRKAWSVKWAAPLADAAPSDSTRTDSHSSVPVEQVWVQPLNWSPFRIEGILCSSPVSELDCGKSLGDLVSFPIEELTDWLHETRMPSPSDPAAPPIITTEGGFTVKVLEARYGKPAASPSPTSSPR